MIKREEVFNLNNFEVAFQRLKFSPKHIHKTIYRDFLKDIEPFREKYFELLIEKFLFTNKIENFTVIRKYLPKNNGFVRPITYIGFEALLVYQAIANKLALSSYDSISKNYNKITFGNHFNSDHNSEFAFLPWKKRWKSYQLVSKKLIDHSDFKYVVDFDIASFYDSIDHKLLMKCLKNHLDASLIETLKSILQLSHSDFKHINPGSGSGIPQGPIASIILSEMFLNFYIDEYFLKQIQKNEISYARYADDIRIFSKNKIVAKKFITILDLLCRNSGLIPQSSKVKINLYKNSSELIDQDIKKFSSMQKIYKIKGALKSKDSNKALKSLKEMLKTDEINKTKFSFYIYKVKKDDELKDLILINIIDRYEFCDPMLFYLKKHYAEDQKVINQLIKIFLIEENFFLDYPIYLFLDKYYKIISFLPEIFIEMYNHKKTGKWLSKISLLRWAYYCGAKEILLTLDPNKVENILLKRELLSIKYAIIDDNSLREDILNKLLKEESLELSLKAISLIHNKMLFESNFDASYLSASNNPIIEKILNGSNYNSVSEILRKNGIQEHNPNILFNNTNFSDENEFDQLSILSTFLVGYYLDKNFKFFIDSIDQFNHIMIERIYFIKENKKNKSDYGSFLHNESFITNEMIGVKEILLKIHLLRNQELHPKDIKTNKFHHKTKYFQHNIEVMEDIFLEWLKAIEEILAWYDKQNIN